jgi:hypothetical protein
MTHIKSSGFPTVPQLCSLTFIDPMSHRTMHFSIVFAIITALTAAVSISACPYPIHCESTADCCFYQTCKSIYIPSSVSTSGLHPVFLRLTGMVLGTIYKHLHLRLDQAWVAGRDSESCFRRYVGAAWLMHDTQIDHAGSIEMLASGSEIRCHLCSE